MTIAEIIFKQLGGGRFVLITGAKNFLGLEQGLLFSLPKNRSGANKVEILINEKDLYDIHFFKARGLNKTCIEKIQDIKAEQLQEIFTEKTGFYAKI